MGRASGRRRLGHDLAGVADGDGLGRLARLAADALDGLDNVHALGDLAEHDVAACRRRAGAAGVRTENAQRHRRDMSIHTIARQQFRV